MRNLLLAALLFVAAVCLVACSDPAKTARREVDRLTRLNQAAEVAMRREVRSVMVATGTAEGKRRAVELRAAGCGPATATQPSTALIDPCRGVVAASEARYEKRLAEVTAVAKKTDVAFIAVYSALLVVLDLVEDIQSGLKADGWQAKLAAVVATAVRLYGDALLAVTAAKAAIGGVP